MPRSIHSGHARYRSFTFRALAVGVVSLLGFGLAGCGQNDSSPSRIYPDGSGSRIRSLDREGYDEYGFDRAGFDREGYDREGYDRDGFDRSGFDHLGYDRKRFSRDGHDRDGFNAAGFDRAGFGRDGRDKQGFDRKGFDSTGYDRRGRDRAGFGSDGFNDPGRHHRGHGDDDSSDDNTPSATLPPDVSKDGTASEIVAPTLPLTLGSADAGIPTGASDIGVPLENADGDPLETSASSGGSAGDTGSVTASIAQTGDPVSESLEDPGLETLKASYQDAYKAFMDESGRQPRDQSAWQSAFERYQTAAEAYHAGM